MNIPTQPSSSFCAFQLVSYHIGTRLQHWYEQRGHSRTDHWPRPYSLDLSSSESAFSLTSPTSVITYAVRPRLRDRAISQTRLLVKDILFRSAHRHPFALAAVVILGVVFVLMAGSGSEGVGYFMEIAIAGFAPTFVADARLHKNRAATFALNLCFLVRSLWHQWG